MHMLTSLCRRSATVACPLTNLDMQLLGHVILTPAAMSAHKLAESCTWLTHWLAEEPNHNVRAPLGSAKRV